ncbi:MAG TPA: hypothetical protein VHY08_20265 [Bacillota bacterium]|nr:hypothetical protein [Bacillota bacterium]
MKKMKNWKLTLLLCALLVSVCNTMTWAADWPRFLGPDASGISPETGLNKDWAAKPPKMLWKVNLYNLGYAGPSVAGESIAGPPPSWPMGKS